MALNVLLVDDDVEYCAMLKQKLEATGEYAVTVVTDATKAEASALQLKPGLILLDNVMPGRMGSEIAKVLKKKGSETRGIPLIMVSGKGEFIYHKKINDFKWEPNNPAVKTRGVLPEAKGAEALAQAFGVDDYVAKPFKIETLLDVIKDVLARFKPAEEETKGDDSVI